MKDESEWLLVVFLNFVLGALYLDVWSGLSRSGDLGKKSKRKVLSTKFTIPLS